MLNKGFCCACKRAIQNTLFDMCMYCGEPLANDQKFTNDEKSKIKNNKRNCKHKNDDASFRLNTWTDTTSGFDFNE